MDRCKIKHQGRLIYNVNFDPFTAKLLIISPLSGCTKHSYNTLIFMEYIVLSESAIASAVPDFFASVLEKLVLL